jgi:hypothetical protein
MGLFDGGGTPSAPAPVPMPPPAPATVLPGEEKAKEDLRERLRRARSRALSRVTEFGLLEEPAQVARPVLSSTL